MGTLNPNLLSKHASLILNASAKIMTSLGKRLLMPEMVLLGLIRTPDTSARRILDKIATERGFKLADLDHETEAQVKAVEKVLNYDDALLRIYRKGDQEFSVYIAYWRAGKMPARAAAIARLSMSVAKTCTVWICLRASMRS